MFYIKKRLIISSAHCLDLNYDSKCTAIHGHNWEVIIYCKAKELDENGMVIDFTVIKEKVMVFDHTFLNNMFESGFNPTAENMARYFVNSIPFCYKATVIESENNEATYERD